MRDTTIRTIAPKEKPTIGMLTGLSGEYFGWAQAGVMAAARKLGFRLLMLPVASNAQYYHLTREKLARIFPFDERNLDGLILAFPGKQHHEIAAHLKHLQGLPVAIVGREVKDFSCFVPDAYEAFSTAVRVLAESGRERIAFLGGPETEYVTQSRLAGYVAGLRDAGMNRDHELIVTGSDFLVQSGYDSTAELLRSGKPFSALVAANDYLAAGAMKALREAGKRVPGEVAVVGFDNNSICSELDPPLCSLTVPAYEMGWTAAASLVAFFREGKPLPDKVQIRCPWRLRASAGISHQFLARILGCDETDYALELVARPLAEELRRYVHTPPSAAECALADRLIESAGTAGQLTESLELLDEFLLPGRCHAGTTEKHAGVSGIHTIVEQLKRAPPQEFELEEIERRVEALVLEIAGRIARSWAVSESGHSLVQVLMPFTETATNVRAEITDVLERSNSLIGGDYVGVFLAEHDGPMTRVSKGKLILWRPDTGIARSETDRVLGEFRIHDVIETNNPAWRLSIVPLVLGDYVFGFLLLDAECRHFRYFLEQARRFATALYFSFINREMLSTQKMELLGELASGMAHDFNNILAEINGYAELAANQVGGPEMLPRHMEQIRSSARRASVLIQKVLNPARPSPRQFQPTQINDVLQDLRIVLSQTFPATIDIHVDLDPSLPLIEGNPDELHQVFLNAAINARDAINGEGSLTIRTWLAGNGEVPARSNPPAADGYVCVSVADTGCGMDAPTVQRVFEPFFTTKPKGQGTGLGLAVSAKIVRDHNGVIDVQSSRGQGSTFRFLFPVQTAPSPQREIEVGETTN